MPVAAAERGLQLRDVVDRDKAHRQFFLRGEKPQQIDIEAFGVARLPGQVDDRVGADQRDEFLCALRICEGQPRRG